MSSPIFDATFGTGRFRHEEPMITDRLSSSAGVACDVRQALELQLFDLVELARDSRSDKGGEAKWVHPRGDLVKEFAKRIAPLAQSDARAEQALGRAADGLSYAATCLQEAEWLVAAELCLREETRARALTAVAQSDAGPDRSVHGELIPDCPTDGVAARQGNGG